MRATLFPRRMSMKEAKKRRGLRGEHPYPLLRLLRSLEYFPYDEGSVHRYMEAQRAKMNLEFCRQSPIARMSRVFAYLFISGVATAITSEILTGDTFLFSVGVTVASISFVTSATIFFRFRIHYNLYQWFWKSQSFQKAPAYGVAIPQDVLEAEQEVRKAFPQAVSTVHYLGLDPIWKVEVGDEEYFAAIWDETGEISKMK